MVMYYYLSYFFIFSIIGYIYENVFHLILKGSLTNNPFIGPYMPVYGFGIVIMLLIENFAFKKFKMPRWGKILLTLLLNFFILTILELIGGNIVEYFFHKSFWDYSGLRFNYGKYIAVEVSLGWALASYIFLFIAKKYLDKLIVKVPRSLTNIFIVIFLLDFIYSFFFK